MFAETAPQDVPGVLEIVDDKHQRPCIGAERPFDETSEGTVSGRLIPCAAATATNAPLVRTRRTHG